jgi:uncharacterized protein
VTPVLLDTGPIVALLDRSERHHRACREVLESIDGPLVTCEAVIAEACYLLRNIRGAQDAIFENIERRSFDITFHLDASTKVVRTLMKRYATVPMDFADGCLVAMADELGAGRILTLDDDFKIYRWGRSRKFELLIDLD